MRVCLGRTDFHDFIKDKARSVVMEYFEERKKSTVVSQVDTAVRSFTVLEEISRFIGCWIL